MLLATLLIYQGALLPAAGHARAERITIGTRNKGLGQACGLARVVGLASSVRGERGR